MAKKKKWKGRKHIKPETNIVEDPEEMPIIETPTGYEVPMKVEQYKVPIRKTAKLSYNDTVGKLIADQVAQGKSLNQIVKDPELNAKGVPKKSTTIRRWVKNYPQFAAMLHQAMVDRADYYLEKMFDVMERVEHGELKVSVGRFLCDEYKWVLAKMHPKYQEHPVFGKAGINVQTDSPVQFNITLAPTATTENSEVIRKAEEISQKIQDVDISLAEIEENNG